MHTKNFWKPVIILQTFDESNRSFSETFYFRTFPNKDTSHLKQCYFTSKPKEITKHCTSWKSSQNPLCEVGGLLFKNSPLWIDQEQSAIWFCLKNGQHLTPKILCYPLSKIGVFDFLISSIFRKKSKKWKTSLVNSRWFCFAFHANLMSDGKKKRLKFLFISPLILLINMSISLFC